VPDRPDRHPKVEAWLSRSVSRRSLLLNSALLCAAPYARLIARNAAMVAPPWATSPFGLGVASGDPTPGGVVLWTRLAPDPLHGGGMDPSPVTVNWEVAADDRMRRIVQRGSEVATAEWAHSVHVEVEGLDPDRWYWYRFTAADAESPIGRTRTLPPAASTPDRLHFAFVSCQHYEQGLFTAYDYLSTEDVDLIFHLGDYIYEGAGVEGRVRKHTGPRLATLEDYRNRYAQYKSDPYLQAAHARAPWFVTPDDHEVQNDYAGASDSSEALLLQRAAAYRAYYEHQPLRRASMPRGPAAQFYRRSGWGTLASFHILDTRQYRTTQPCGDGVKPLCEGVFDPNATLMGDAQERWLFDGLRRDPSRWHLIPQQVMMARVDQQSGQDQRFSMDQWPGYDAQLKRMMTFLGEARPSNPVVLTGDIHANYVNDLKLDFANPASPTVGTELVGTSISSGGDGADRGVRTASMLDENPFVKYFNGQRGYVRCTVTAESLHADYEGVDYVTRPDAPLLTRASFVVENGRPGAHRG
jgi:alkaline phosphatase D